MNFYYPGDLTQIRSLDLLVEVQNALGRRLRLQSLAEGTLKAKKSGDGLQSVRWWQEGLYDKVREYCIDDVRLTPKLLRLCARAWSSEVQRFERHEDDKD